MNRKVWKLCIVVICLAVIMGFTARTVSGMERRQQVPSVESYEIMETEYLTGIKRVLAENDYNNCGVNMTKVIEADDSRTYTVMIYHKRLNSADSESKRTLLNKLMALDSLKPSCTVEYQL